MAKLRPESGASDPCFLVLSSPWKLTETKREDATSQDMDKTSNDLLQ